MEVSTSLSLLLAATLTFSAAAQAEQATPQQIEQTGKAAEAYFAAHPEKWVKLSLPISLNILSF